MGAKTKEADFIQVQLALLITISAYIEKVKEGNYVFPDFHDCCPLCHSNRCAVRIGYYYRNIIHIQESTQGNFIQRIPVARYLCRRKANTKYRTFSLLPDALIPYYAITIDTLIFIILQILSNNHSFDKALERIDKVSPEEVMLSERTLSRCCILFSQSRIKLLIFLRKNMHRQWFPPGCEFYTDTDLMHYISGFSAQGIPEIKSNACRLSRFYYSEEGACINNARFLFGTASQFR